MTERPILFDMVRAVRENKKTQTRRTRGLDKINAEPDMWALDGGEFDPAGWRFLHCSGGFSPNDKDVTIRCPYGVAGDRLWTREAWRVLAGYDLRKPRELCGDWIEFFYESDCPLNRGKLRPSIHMPSWASRDTLEVVSARPERLQDITEEDAIAEGTDNDEAWRLLRRGEPNYRSAYFALWDSINGKTLPWSKNPWVWRIEFLRITK